MNNIDVDNVVQGIDVSRHKDFRVFGAMNPPTDVGKKELPPSIRGKFTEIYTEEVLDAEDLKCIVRPLIALNDVELSNVVNVYLECRNLSEGLSDGAGLRPHYSLRTLTRTVKTASALRSINIPHSRSLYEAVMLNFQKLLSSRSRTVLTNYLSHHGYFPNDLLSLDHLPPCPRGKARGKDWIEVRPFWLQCGPNERVDWSQSQSNVVRFVLNQHTPTVRNYIRDIASGVAANVAPILLQGPTSVGKTTMIEYLAARTGHTCIRINNHEHTDVQEYIGSFVTSSSGQLEFKDGLLVEALRKGYWIILDELNLAPTDVLEALNRLLDDNRELLIPETAEVVVPSPGFFLFATQNPPGAYGGRKPLSRAFRNRFLEICVDDLPLSEVKEIVSKSCGITEKISSLLVECMKVLHEKRQGSTVFSGKYGAMTVRDLIKWGNRRPGTTLEAAEKGYLILSEKFRLPDEKKVVEATLNSVFKVTLDVDNIYNRQDFSQLHEAQLLVRNSNLAIPGVGKIALTSSFRRLWILVADALAHVEPVLIIGETGCGKTTVCQLMSSYKNHTIRILNCHQSTETADIIGGLRPIRGHGMIRTDLCNLITTLGSRLIHSLSDFSVGIYGKLVDGVDIDEKHLHQIIDELCSLVTDSVALQAVGEDFDVVVNIEKLKLLWKRYKSLFEWVDGPLVSAMKNGDYFLLDEINLADDAVIERLNSVLESGRSITLTEKGGIISEKIVAHPNFRFLATMNPGGDYGKRELSPALSSRFTEIWVPSTFDDDSVLLLVSEALHFADDCELAPQIVATLIVAFFKFFRSETVIICGGCSYSIREVLAWSKFIAKCASTSKNSVLSAYLHGAYLLFLDGLGIGSNVSKEKLIPLKKRLVDFLCGQCIECGLNQSSLGCFFDVSSRIDCLPTIVNEKFVLGQFSIPLGDEELATNKYYNGSSKITVLNFGRVLRAMQLSQPVLLEGPPGVGKSSLISNLALLSGHKLIRINLSEHSELSDLLGSDLPCKNIDGPKFEWHDGVFLQAMKQGHWVLLDELNLAPQSVLEGLNACFDHREEVFLPEIGLTVRRSPQFRVFCSQNPMNEGGGRKGLPQSFLNRFSRVFVETMTRDDLLEIMKSLHSDSGLSTFITPMTDFVLSCHRDITELSLFGGLGGPWEFNLRDIFRWCDMVASCLLSLIYDKACSKIVEYVIANSAYFLFVCRMRSGHDRSSICSLFQRTFGFAIEIDLKPKFFSGSDFHLIGLSTVKAGSEVPSFTHGNSKELEGLSICVNLNLPVLLVSHSDQKRLIQYLAKVTGNTIDFFSATPGTDSADLLGSFEQCNSSFEWNNGIVVTSVLAGHWFVMDNVNLCPSSVLDRLNGLLEPGGDLVLTENGLGERIVPHSNFRAFFLMNPSFGEVSRAMRNRCVEIYVGEVDVFGPSYCPNADLAWYSLSAHSLDSNLTLECCRLFSSLCTCKFYDSFPKLELFSRFCLVLKKSIENHYPLEDSFRTVLSLILPGIGDISLEESICCSLYNCVPIPLRDVDVWFFLLNEQCIGSPSPWLELLKLQAELIANLSYCKFNEYVGSLECMPNKQMNFVIALFGLAVLTVQNPKLEAEILLFLGDFLHGEYASVYVKFRNRFSLALSFPLEVIVKYQGDYIFDFGVPAVLDMEVSAFQKFKMWFKVVLNVFIRTEDWLDSDRSLFCLCEDMDSVDGYIVRIARKLLFDLDKLLMISDLLNVLECLPTESAKVICGLWKVLMLRRNILSGILCRNSSLSQLPWNDLLISIRWIKKAVCLIEENTRVHFAGESFFSTFASVYNGIDEFVSFSAKCWKPCAFDTIRLWKEGGHASIPGTIDGWDILKKFRCFFNCGGDVPSCALRISIRAPKFVKDWLLLYSTFYLCHSTEKILSTADVADFHGLISSLEVKMPKKECFRLNHNCPNYEIVAEHVLIDLFSDLSNLLSHFVLVGASLNFVQLSEHLEFIIDFWVNHTNLFPGLLRELQTLSWRLLQLNDNASVDSLESLRFWCKSALIVLDKNVWLMNGEVLQFSHHPCAIDTLTCLSFVDNLLLCGSSSPRNSNTICLYNVESRAQALSQLFCFIVLSGSRKESVDFVGPSSSARERRLAWQEYRVDLLSLYACDIIWSCRNLYQQDVLELVSVAVHGFKDSKWIQFERLYSIVSQSVVTNVDIGNLFRSCLFPLLRILSNSQIYDDSAVIPVADLGKAWVFVGLLRFHLISLSMSIDPAVKPTMKYNLLLDNADFLNSSLSMSKMFNALSGQPLVDLMNYEISEELGKCNEKLLHLKKKGVKRPSCSGSFDDLCCELLGLMKDQLCIDSILSLVSSIDTSRDQRSNLEFVLNKEKGLQTFLSSFCGRLNSQYWAFEDITSILESAIGNISCGIRYLFQDMDFRLSKNRFRWEHFIQYPIVSTIHISVNDDDDVLNSCDGVISQDSLKAVLHFLILKLDHLLTLNAIDLPTAYGKYEKYFTYFSEMYAENTRIKNETKKDSSFNNFIDRDGISEMAVDQSLETSDCTKLVNSHFRLVLLHCSRYFKHHGFVWLHSLSHDDDFESVTGRYLSSANKIFCSGLEIASLCRSGVNPNFLSFDYKYRCSSLQMLALIHEKCLLAEVQPVCLEDASSVDRDLLFLLEGRNGRVDSCPAEIKKVVELVSQLKNKTNDFLAVFPENELLLQVQRISDQILQLHVGTTISVVASNVQHLVKQINEWEVYAAKHVSFSGELQGLVSLVLTWREAEVKSWANLLRSKEIQWVENACSQWYTFFHLFSLPLESKVLPEPKVYAWLSLNNFAPAWLHSAHGPAEIDENILTIFNRIDSTLRQSTIGDFPAKLHLVRLFAIQLHFHLLSNKSGMILKELASVVTCVWRYYDYFLPNIRDHQNKLKDPIQLRVNNEITMEHWNTKSSLAFVEQSEKVHRKLGKAASDYDESVLQLPIATILHDCIMGGIINAAGDVIGADAIPPNVVLFPLISSGLTESSNDVPKDGFGFISSEISESMVVEIFNRLQFLRSNGTKSMKLRAVSDLRNALKDCGVSNLYSTVPSNIQQNACVFSMVSPLGLESLIDIHGHVPLDVLESAEKYFFRNVVEINQIRVQSVSSVSVDFSPFAKEFLGLIENMFCISLKLRCAVSASLSDQKRLIHAVGLCTKKVSLSSCHQSVVLMFDSMVQFTALVKSAESMSRNNSLFEFVAARDDSAIAYAMTMLEKSCKLLYSLTESTPVLENSNSSGMMRHWSNAFIGINSAIVGDRLIAVAKNAFDSFCSVATTLSTLVSIDVVTQQILQFREFVTSVESIGAPDRTQTTDCESLVQWSIECTSRFFKDCSGQGCFGEIFDNACDGPSLVNSIALSLKSLEMCNVDELVNCLEGLGKCGVDFESISSSINVRNILCEYSSRVEGVTMAYKSFGKLLYVTSRLLRTLMAKGLCSDNAADKDADSNEGNTFQEGTGMGSGSGGKDVSNEIDNEEQLLGLKEKEKDDEKVKDGPRDEKVDDGVEMEQDFDGDLMSVSDNKSVEDEVDESEEIGDEEIMDRELGSADAEDVVDERDWKEDDEMGDKCNEDVDVDNTTSQNEDEFITRNRDDCDSLNADSNKSEIDSNVDEFDDKNQDFESTKSETEVEDECIEMDSEYIEDPSDEKSQSSIDDEDITNKNMNLNNSQNKKSESFGVNRRDDNNDNILNEVVNEKEESVPVASLQDSKSKIQGSTGGNSTSQYETSSSNVESSLSRQRQMNSFNPFKYPGNINEFWHNRLDVVDDSVTHTVDDSDEMNNLAGEFGHASDGVHQVLDSAEDNNAEQLHRADDIEDIEQSDMNRKRESGVDTEAGNPRKKSKVLSSVIDEDVALNENMEVETSFESTVVSTTTADEGFGFFKTNRDWIFGSKVSDLADLSNAVHESVLVNSLGDSHAAGSVEGIAVRLCEQLRLILEPTLKTRLQGDYRSGKRLNMRKIIPFIASGYRKDKIWLRRNKPAKRNYQIMLMTDNSKSMGIAGSVAISTMITIATALTKLEAGEICLVKFDERVHILHEFGKLFGETSIAKVRSQFDFRSGQTKLGHCLHSVLPIFEEGKSRLALDDSIVLQLCFVISDARIDSDNRLQLDEVIRKMSEKNILVVLVVIDKNADPKDSIFNTKSVSFEGSKVVTTSYFDDFPFPFYVAIQNVSVLPDLLSSALKQWFELVNVQLKG